MRHRFASGDARDESFVRGAAPRTARRVVDFDAVTDSVPQSAHIERTVRTDRRPRGSTWRSAAQHDSPRPDRVVGWRSHDPAKSDLSFEDDIEGPIGTALRDTNGPEHGGNEPRRSDLERELAGADSLDDEATG
jgi:hypothetical protein